VTPCHVPPILSFEKRVGADTQLALLDLGPRAFAGGLLASGKAIRCMLCITISIAARLVWKQLTQAPLGAFACVIFDAFRRACGSRHSRHVERRSCGVGRVGFWGCEVR
jgi:hypothetical protein